MIRTSRSIAFLTLLQIEKSGTYSNIALDSSLKKSGLDQNEKAFASALIYGVIERKITLDYNIGLYLKTAVSKLKKNVLTILRIGAYQLFFMGSVPASAAVNESVSLSKQMKLNYASSLINAVLRKCADNGLSLPEKDDPVNYISVAYSCSPDIVELLAGQYGFDFIEAYLKSTLNTQKIFARVNTLKTDPETLRNVLLDEGVESKPGPIGDSLILNLNSNRVSSLKAFEDGLFHVQDISSQICSKAVNASAGETIFDLCAAPGGKTFTIAEEMKNSGSVFAFDLYPHRVDLIKSGAERLGISIINAEVSDSLIFDGTLPEADAVLCDVPCSGLGIVSRKPEIKYKSVSETEGLSSVQMKILENGAKYVRVGGRLIYSTCSINKNENENIVNSFLTNNNSFSLDSSFNEKGYITLFPNVNDCDGFFVSVMKRND